MENYYSNSLLKPIKFGDFSWEHGFWKEREDLCIENTIDSVYAALNHPDNCAQLGNFHILAGEYEGSYVGSTHWGDGDCYKWIEGAIYVWYKTKDPSLKEKIDYEINAIAKAQLPNGYIDTFIQFHGKEPFVTGIYHEDYNFGHLFSTAVAHYTLTGEDTLLNVAIKLADCLYNEFMPNPKKHARFGWNPSQLMGLTELYRVTGDKRYLDLSEFFIRLKGSSPVVFDQDERPGIPDTGGDLTQERVPLEDETLPEGHSVTAVYLYSGAADLCMEKPLPKMEEALKTISKHLYEKRIYLTGGVGPIHHGYSSRNDPVREAFANDYILPLSTAYNETCANIGNAFWQWRMFLLTGESVYMDHVENTIYNSGLSGMSADGMKFRYTNPLRWHGKDQILLLADSYERWSTSNGYCCPPQLARTISSMHKYGCAQGENSLYINLFGGSNIKTEVNEKNIDLSMKTLYPWEGLVEIEVNEDINDFSLLIRIPSYSKKNLLTFRGENIDVVPGTYCEIHSDFKKGDKIVLELDISVRKIKTHEKVEESRNQMAIMRGPVVYCIEGADVGDEELQNIYVSRDVKFTPKYEKDLLEGITVLEGVGSKLCNPTDELYSEWGDEIWEEVPIKLIPYYAWNNRGLHNMCVYLPVK